MNVGFSCVKYARYHSFVLRGDKEMNSSTLLLRNKGAH